MILASDGGDSWSISQLGRDGGLSAIPEPDGLVDSPFACISTAFGCLRTGPVLLFGGPSPDAAEPVRVELFVDQVWSDITDGELDDSAGGVPSNVFTSDGSVVFDVATGRGGELPVRQRHMIIDGRGVVHRVELDADTDGPSTGGVLRRFHDSATGSLVEFRVGPQSVTVVWS